MRTRIAGLTIGIVFGVVLSWSGMSNPSVIRGALLFEDSYLFLFFAAAVGTAAVGLQLVKRYQRRAVLTGGPVGWTQEKPQRRHIVGSLIFGLGWGVSCACPGPIATQIGQGIPWAIFTMAGALTGVYLYLRREQPETEPAYDTVSAPAPPRAPARSPS
jgi:uncharacterized membrane protein YedE/YeeE